MTNQKLSGNIFFSFLCVLVIVSAGCIGADYVANRDIIVIKLNPDGTTAWTKLIDTGYDDAAQDMIETLDGDYVIAAQNSSGRMSPPRPRLIRLSSAGTVLWDRILSGSPGEPTAVIQTRDGGYAAASYDGDIWRVDPAGNTLWTRSTGIRGVWSVIGTGDSGFVIAGEQEGRIPFGSVTVYNTDGSVSSRQPYANETSRIPGCSETSIPAGPHETVMVTMCTAPYELVSQAVAVKLDSRGNVSWQRSYGAEGLESAWSVIEASPDRGYLLSGFGKIPERNGSIANHIYAVQLASNGTALQVTRLDRIEYFRPAQMRSISDGYAILFVNTTLKDGYYHHEPVEVHLDRNGHMMTMQPLDAGYIIAWTRDGGYFSAGFPVTGGSSEYSESIYGQARSDRLHAMKLNPDGSRAWDRTIPDVVVNHVRKVIQTSDGGYAILAVKENY